MDNLLESSNNYISVETLMPRWSRVEIVIPRDAFAKDPTHLVRSLEAIHLSAKDSEQVKQFIKARSDVEASRKRFEDILKSSKYKEGQ
jgi:hypothetical protein